VNGGFRKAPRSLFNIKISGVIHVTRNFQIKNKGQPEQDTDGYEVGTTWWFSLISRSYSILTGRVRLGRSMYCREALHGSRGRMRVSGANNVKLYGANSGRLVI